MGVLDVQARAPVRGKGAHDLRRQRLRGGTSGLPPHQAAAVQVRCLLQSRAEDRFRRCRLRHVESATPRACRHEGCPTPPVPPEGRPRAAALWTRRWTSRSTFPASDATRCAAAPSTKMVSRAATTSPRCGGATGSGTSTTASSSQRRSPRCRPAATCGQVRTSCCMSASRHDTRTHAQS